MTMKGEHIYALAWLLVITFIVGFGVRGSVSSGGRAVSIFILSTYDGIQGVFSTAEKSAEYAKRVGISESAEEYEVDGLAMPELLKPGKYLWLVQICAGTAECIGTAHCQGKEFMDFCPNIEPQKGGTWRFFVRAEDEAEATRLAKHRLAAELLRQSDEQKETS